MVKARILVVEDEGIIAEDIRTSLQDQGYDVIGVVATGEDAVKTAKDTQPDLVLMDIVLGGDEDGIDTAQRIQNDLDVPVIYLTAFADDKMVQRAKTTVPFAYLIKPYRDTELHTNIEVALYKHNLERKLRESEEWLSVTLKSIGEGVIATDADGAVKFINPEAESLTGRKQKEALGTPLEEIFDARSAKTGRRQKKAVRDLLKITEPVDLADGFNLLETKGGERLEIEAAAAPIKDEKARTIGIVITFRDVTERTRAQARLRLLSGAVEQSSEGIAVADLDGSLLFVNQAAADMHGYSLEDLEDASIEAFHAKEQMSAVNKANQATQKKGTFSGEIPHRRKNGETFPTLAHNALLHDADDQPVGIIMAIRDITALKEAEEALRRSNEGLEQKVAERTKDLEESRKEIKRYSESLEKANEALKLVISSIEEQKTEVEERIAHNLNLTIKPVIDQLKSQDLPDTVQFLVKSLEFNLSNLFSSFGMKLMKEGHRLTPREVRICEMIRSGLSSKQMAKIMGISPQTILVHRKNVRKKLGLAKSRQNLASYLKANL